MAKPAAPNIILIMADDMGYGDVDIYGQNSNAKTPNISRMAREGILLTDFHSNGSVSSPTRAALMTGRYQQRSGVTGVIKAEGSRKDGLALEEFTMAEALKELGYTTAMFGKWHLGYEPKFNPVNQGFDIFEGYVSGNVDYHSHVDQANIHDWWQGSDKVHTTGYTTDLITNRAVEFIDKHPKKTPFFLYLPHEAPHSPTQGRNSPVIRHEEGRTYSQPTTEPKTKRELHQEMIEVLDEGIGRVLEAVERSGQMGNTIILFTSDNGAMGLGSSAPLRGKKGSLFEGGHRVPTVIYSPKVKLAPKMPYVYEQATATMDLLPSFVTLAGGTPPANLDGVDIFTTMRKGAELPARDIFWAFGNSRALRRGDWKMVLQKDKVMLFNLADDLAEKNNVAEQNPELVKEMRQAIAQWFREVTPKK